MRIEKDFISEVELPDDYLFGINTFRAEKNFAFSEERILVDIFKAIIEVKKAAISANYRAGLITENIFRAVQKACDEVLEDVDKFLPDLNPLQGGAGTSTNMAANELLANLALIKLGYKPGNYDIISPLTHINLCQSTNDVYPTAVRIALIRNLRALHQSVENFLKVLLEKEKEFYPLLKVARTELQDAVPISLGQEFSAYAEAISRFRWRLEKAIEWVREVNLSGTAVGTGINADDLYSFYVIQELREISSENVVLSKNLIDGTQNIDQLVETSGIVRTGAVAVKKICFDLRLLASGPQCGFNELILPLLQAGSSIMPAKVNPVMLEAVEQVCLQVIAGDNLIALAASESILELPQFLPLIAHHLIKNIKIFGMALKKLSPVILQTKANNKVLEENLQKSDALATLLSIYIGYERSSEFIKEARKNGRTLIDFLIEKKIISREDLQKVLTPEMLAAPGLPFIRKDDGNG